MVRNFWPIWTMFFYVFFCNISKVKNFLYCFIILCRLIFSFLHIRSLLVPYAYVSAESIDCVFVSSLEAIFLISSVKTLWVSLLNLCLVFNISLFFMNFF